KLLQPLVELLGFTPVQARDGKLIISGNEWLPTGPNTFRRADREEATLAFVEDGGRTYKIAAFASQEQEPMWRAVLLVAVGAVLALGLVFSIVMLPFWLIAAL